MQYHALFVSLILLAACGRSGGKSSAPVPEKGANEARANTDFRLSSPDFREGERIPRRHAFRGEGDNVPPRLLWTGVPQGTAELALVVDDPDAPTAEPWVHDVLYHIPVDASPDEMVSRMPRGGNAETFTAGKNSWNETGWGGPKPPPGKPHRYFFRLYALSARLDLEPGATKAQLLEAMKGRILAEAVLMGTYQR